MSNWFLVAVIVAHLLLVAASAWPQFDLGSPRISEDFQRLQEKTHGAVKISHGPNGGVFLSLPSNQAASLQSLVSNADLLNAANTLPRMSLAFVQEYHSLWGFHSAQQAREQVFVKHTETDSQLAGHSHVIMEQQFAGVRVFGGDLRAHFTKDGKLSAINGLLVNNLNEMTIPSTQPGINAEEASAIAINAVADMLLAKPARRPYSAQNPAVIKDQLRTKAISSENLLIFRKDVISLNPRDSTPRLVWEIEVSSSSLAVRDQVMVDAHTGEVVNHISMIQHSLQRRVFEKVFSENSLVWQEGDASPTNDTQMMDILSGNEAFYAFFSTSFDWLSYDGKDAIMNSVYHVEDPNECPNAWWDDTKMNFCTGITALDVAVHELTHAVTSFTDKLFYQFQSGALNEAYSDIFAETINILTGTNSLSQVLRTTGSCSIYGEGSPANDASTRWLIGEDVPAEYNHDKHGFRDMWQPECYGDPESVNRQSYSCEPTDNGGVHTNSGVINHAYALVVDGGEFGGYSITGIGFNKAVAVWWRAKRHYQSSTTNFVDHANALHQSCADLIGQTVRNVTTGDLEEIISQNDCNQISNAIEAVNMTVNPMSVCDFVSFGTNKTNPATCPSGENGNLIFFEDFKVSAQGWIPQSIDPDKTSKGILWQRLCNNDSSVCGLWSPSLALGQNPNGKMWALNVLISPSINITSSGNAVLSFNFSIDTKSGRNGGAVSAFVNGEEHKFSDSDFLYNPFNGVIIDTPVNQLNNEPVWTGFTGASKEDYLLHMEDLLFQTRIKINNLQEGDILVLQFGSAEDLYFGPRGFFITDVAVTMCDTENRSSSASESHHSSSSFNSGSGNEASLASTLVPNHGISMALLALLVFFLE